MRVKLHFLIVLAAALLAAPAAGAGEGKSPKLAKYDKRVDASVEKALAYLAKSQIKAGSLAGSFSTPGMPGNTGVSSLCVLAFLAKGHTPGTGKYGGHQQGHRLRPPHAAQERHTDGP